MIPVRPSVLIVLAVIVGGWILGGAVYCGAVRPASRAAMQAADASMDDTQLKVLGYERLADTVQPDGMLGPPRVSELTPITDVPGLQFALHEGMHTSPTGEPYLYQCVGGRYRLLSHRGKGRYRMFDSGTGRLTDVDESALTGPWP